MDASRLSSIISVGVAVVVLLPACRQPPPAPANMIGMVREQLARREAQISSMQFRVTTRQAEVEAVHQVWMRGRNLFRAETLEPEHLEVSFDGQRVMMLQHKRKSFAEFRLEVEREEGAYLLAQTFAPFVPEGYRMPLLPKVGVEASRRTLQAIGDVVELRYQTADQAGIPVAAAYVYQWPSLNFVSRSLRSASHVIEDAGEGAWCSGPAEVCFPRRIVHSEDGEIVSVATVTSVQFNPEIPNDSFVLVAPDGYQRLQHEVHPAAATH